MSEKIAQPAARLAPMQLNLAPNACTLSRQPNKRADTLTIGKFTGAQMQSKLACSLVLISFAAGGAFAAQAPDTASYPIKPIRLVVPQAPGGSNDIWARYFGGQLGERLGRQVVVDNRPGADGIIGTELVSKANPDGYTLLMTSTAFVMNPAVFKLPYDPVKDFDWALMLGTGPVVVTVNAALPVKSLQDLIALGKSKPNYLTIASAGGFMHFVSAMFKSRAGLDATIVLYKGGAPALIDVISGQAQLAISTLVTVGPHLRSGKIRGLAVGSPKRSKALPDLPTTAEAGLPGYEAEIWWAWSTRAGTPAAVLHKLNAEVAVIQKMPETEKRFAVEGAEVVLRTPAEIKAMIPKDIAKWTKVAQEAGMQKK
jgi:tripartite-type tricarboxylate transporter receptor subunit TctC